jgi:hypothetical protein
VKYRIYGIDIQSSLPLPEAGRSSSKDCSLAIELSPDAFGDSWSWFHSWPQRGRARAVRKPWLAFGKHDGRFLLRFPDLAEFEISAEADRIRCRPRPRLAPSTLRHLLLDQVLPLAVSLRGQLVLHASAVHVPGFGVISFAGLAGCGKSTLAAALGMRRCSVVTDDALVLARNEDDEEVYAVPGYPGLRLWRDSAHALAIDHGGATRVAHYTAKRRLAAGRVAFRARPAPLRAVAVLGRRVDRRQQSRVRALDARQALMAVAPFAYVMDPGDRQQLHRMFDGLANVVARVPVCRVAVRDDRRNLVEAAGEVLDGLRLAAVDS